MRCQRLERFEDLVPFDDPVLDEFAEAFTQLPLGERLERADVAEDRDGILEDAGQILAGRQIDAGLPADRCVDHRDERRGDVDERDAAHVGRRGETEEVAADAAADADRERRAIGSGLG
jgi:hypothetical protein